MRIFEVFSTAPCRRILAIIGLLLLLRLVALSAFPLIDPSEGRYGEISSSMATNGDFVVPRFHDGVPFWGKPPMYFWAAAFSIEAFGTSAFSARLPSFVFSILSLVCVGLLARARYGERVAWISALVLSTSLMFFVLAGVALVDTALAFFIVLTLLAFSSASARKKYDYKYWGFLLLAAIGTAGAVLSKGGLALAVIAPPIYFWMLEDTRTKLGSARKQLGLPSILTLLKALLIPAAVLCLGVLMSAPWHLLAEAKTPGFLNYYIIGEHFLRFIQPEWESLYGKAHVEPKGTVWVFLVVGLLPWAIIVPAMLFRHRRQLSWREWLDRIDWPLLSWAATLPVLFTFTDGVMIPYLLPVLPAWAILCAIAISNLIPTEDSLILLSKPRIAAIAGVPAIALFVLFAVFPLIGVRRSDALLIASIEQLDSDNNSAVTYLGRASHSSEFYSLGTVQETEQLSVRNMRTLRENSKQDYFIVPRGQRAQFDKMTGKGTLEFVIGSPKRVVYREVGGDDAAVSTLKKSLPLSYYLTCYWLKYTASDSSQCSVAANN